MRCFHDPHAMTAEERLREIAAMLARGLLRIQNRPRIAAAPAWPSRTVSESAAKGLELSNESRLTVLAG